MWTCSNRPGSLLLLFVFSSLSDGAVSPVPQLAGRVGGIGGRGETVPATNWIPKIQNQGSGKRHRGSCLGQCCLEADLTTKPVRWWLPAGEDGKLVPEEGFKVLHRSLALLHGSHFPEGPSKAENNFASNIAQYILGWRGVGGGASRADLCLMVIKASRMCAAPLPTNVEGIYSGRHPTNLASAALLCKLLAAPLPAKASQGTYYQNQVLPLLRALLCFTWFKYRSYKKEGEGAQRRQELLHAALAATVALHLHRWLTLMRGPGKNTMVESGRPEIKSYNLLSLTCWAVLSLPWSLVSMSFFVK